ncbi:MAG: OB-fold domain-containing protein [Acidimicrobiia bacterium]|nr:OB-fold domain-containing protein [Acidimicrobiia bacterium]
MSETGGVPPLVPEPDQVSAPFWDACRRHELVVQTCTACGRARYHPRPMCPHCGSMEHTWEPASGDAVLYSWVVAHRPVLPALADRVPLPIVLVELPEGVRMVGNLAGDAGELVIGMPMRVAWVDVTGTCALPAWRPAG